MAITTDVTGGMLGNCPRTGSSHLVYRMAMAGQATPGPKRLARAQQAASLSFAPRPWRPGTCVSGRLSRSAPLPSRLREPPRERRRASEKVSMSKFRSPISRVRSSRQRFLVLGGDGHTTISASRMRALSRTAARRRGPRRRRPTLDGAPKRAGRSGFWHHVAPRDAVGGRNHGRSRGRHPLLADIAQDIARGPGRRGPANSATPLPRSSIGGGG